MSIIPLIVSVAAVAAAAAYAVQWRQPHKNGFVAAGMSAHVAALAVQLYEKPLLHLGLLLSLFMLLTFLICWRALVFTAMRRLLLLLTAVAAVSPLLLPVTQPAAFSLHSVLALLVYTLAGGAFLLCLDVRLAEQSLRRQPQQSGAPPLLRREKQYFTYVLLSFAVLTLTLLSGIATASGSGQPLFVLTHKQLFAYLTWLVFLALLLGRHFLGWRGQTAQRWFFSGYAFLLLSYIGSTVIAQLIVGG